MTKSEFQKYFDEVRETSLSRVAGLIFGEEPDDDDGVFGLSMADLTRMLEALESAASARMGEWECAMDDAKGSDRAAFLQAAGEMSAWDHAAQKIACLREEIETELFTEKE